MDNYSLTDIINFLLCFVAIPAVLIWAVIGHRRWLDNMSPRERREFDEHSRNPGDW
jgi:hypothetical protein